MARIFVTGATGFIGGHVARCLSEQGHQVVACARKATKCVRAALAGCTWVEWDLVSGESPSPEPGGGVDLVYHAATANDILSRNSRAGVELSLLGTERLFTWARDHGVAQMVFLSTFQVYGQELQGRIDETSPVRCSNDYALNHWFGEEMLRLRTAQMPEGPRVIVLRPSNVYGLPWNPVVDRWTLVPMCFCLSAIREGRLELRSSGKQERNFVHLDQLAHAARLCLRTPPSSRFSILNIASRHQHSILSLARLTQEAYRQSTGKDLPLHILSEAPAAGNSFVVDSARWERWSGGENSFRSQDRLETTIRDLIEGLRSGQIQTPSSSS